VRPPGWVPVSGEKQTGDPGGGGLKTKTKKRGKEPGQGGRTRSKKIAVSASKGTGKKENIL